MILFEPSLPALFSFSGPNVHGGGRALVLEWFTLLWAKDTSDPSLSRPPDRTPTIMWPGFSELLAGLVALSAVNGAEYHTSPADLFCDDTVSVELHPSLMDGLSCTHKFACTLKLTHSSTPTT